MDNKLYSFTKFYKQESIKVSPIDSFYRETEILSDFTDRNISALYRMEFLLDIQKDLSNWISNIAVTL